MTGLTVYEWTQGCFTIIKREVDEVTRQSMMSLLRSTLWDAMLHGFETAWFSYNDFLSLMEDSILHWHHARIAEEMHEHCLGVSWFEQSVFCNSSVILEKTPYRHGQV
jgi:hypothetical protein